jgi:hypothetical protein
MYLSSLGAGLLAFASLSSASAIAARGDGGSTNSPSNRQAWSNGFDIDTDFAEKFPDTGVVRKVSRP